IELVRDTTTAGGGAKLELDPDAPKQAPTPAWLEPEVMATRQDGLHDRLEEVRARLAAAVESPPPADKQPDPQQAKLLERVKTALPSVTTASTEMTAARASLIAKELKAAL